MNSNTVYTIGHSVHTFEAFVGLLKRHRIEAVADVRSMPYSRWQPQFNREDLRASLKREGIAYVFLGKELGARSDEPDCYECGKVQYRKIARTALFQAGIDRVRGGARKMRLTLMCAEKDPLECHRTILVARELTEAGSSVVHILPDGMLETHEQAMKRLLGMLSMPEHDLFRSDSELLDNAYAEQERRIAYVDDGLVRQAQEAKV